MYCGQSRSSEFTAVIPAEAKTLPSPVIPRSLAPQGTASIFSIMARSLCFFLSPANAVTASMRASAVISGVLLVIKPPSENCFVFQVAARQRQNQKNGRQADDLPPRNEVT